MKGFEDEMMESYLEKNSIKTDFETSNHCGDKQGGKTMEGHYNKVLLYLIFKDNLKNFS